MDERMIEYLAEIVWKAMKFKLQASLTVDGYRNVIP